MEAPTAVSDCRHPHTRHWAWYAHDGVICVACCDCGAVLTGGYDLDKPVEDEQIPPDQRKRIRRERKKKPMITTPTGGEQSTALAAIIRERAFQTEKWGSVQDHPHEVGGWLTLLRRELREAEDAWCTQRGDAEALKEILQVAAVAVACLEQHGTVERAEVAP